MINKLDKSYKKWFRVILAFSFQFWLESFIYHLCRVKLIYEYANDCLFFFVRWLIVVNISVLSGTERRWKSWGCSRRRRIAMAKPAHELITVEMEQRKRGSESHLDEEESLLRPLPNIELRETKKGLWFVLLLI